MYGEADADVCNGTTGPRRFGRRPSSARSRDGTTPPTPPRRRSSHLRQALGARRFATIDPEEFYDFQNTRPKIRMIDGQARSIEWPKVELYEARIPRAPRDLLLLVGTEPSYRWRTFTR